MQAVTTLVSMCDTKMVDKNLDSALSPLTPHETKVMQHLLENIFGDMTQRHWEGVELRSYWDAVRK